MWAAEIGTRALRYLAAREQAVRLDNGTFAVDPLGLDRIEPGAFDRQVARQDPYAVALLLDLLVVGMDPAAHVLADVPGSVVPDQGPDQDVLPLQLRAAPGQEPGGDGAHRAPVDEAQPDLLGLLPRAGVTHQEAVTGQSLGVGIVFGDRLLHQAQGLGGVGPAMQGWARQPTPRLHQVASRNPSAQPACWSVNWISRSRCLFFADTLGRG